MTRRRRSRQRVRRQLVAAGAAGALLLTAGATLATDIVPSPAGDDVQTVSMRGWITRHLSTWRRGSATVRTSLAPTTTPAPSTGPAGTTPAGTTPAGTTPAGTIPTSRPATIGSPGATSPTATAPTATAPTAAAPTAAASLTVAPGGTGGPTAPSSSGGDRTQPPATLTATSTSTSTSNSTSTTASSSASNSAPVPPTAATAQTSGRRGLWNAIGRTPTASELDAAPDLYGVVVLNIWETTALKRLRQLDPSIVVLAYQDLASVRSYDLGPNPPAGVGWAQANANPSWLATDTSGRRIEWKAYPGHWQAAVWDRGYQQAWTASVVQRVTAAGFDGVLGDNALATLSHYSSQLLAGTSSSAATDAKLRAGLQALVETAGPALQAKGKLLVPNLSDARLYPGRWAAHARWGGAMEENFAHFGTSGDLSSFVTDWGSDGWEGQSAQLSQPGLSLAITRAAPGDQRALRYGYASLLVRGDGDSFWQPSADSGTYANQQSIPEQRWRTGPAAGPGTKVSGGAWTRTYAAVWAAVNPTTGTVTVTAPPGATDPLGRGVRTVQLGPASGVILKLP